MSRKLLKPSRELLEQMIGEGLNARQIASVLGYSPSGWANVYKHLRSYGIEPGGMPHQEIKTREFNPSQKSFIYGSLLGDGSLTPSGNGYRFAVRHTIKQEEYVKWKWEMLSDFVVAKELSYADFVSFGGKVARSVAFTTVTHPFLTELRSKFYPGGEKTVSPEWLALIDPFALSVWYMDDGSRNRNYGTLTLCTNSFSVPEHLVIQNWFKSRWGITAMIEDRRNGQHSIRINKSQAGRFLEIVRPFVPACMNYKLED